MVRNINLIFLVFILICPLFFWVNSTFYIEFIISSVLINFTFLFISRKDRLTSGYLNIAQIVYSFHILWMASVLISSDGSIKYEYLYGDSSNYLIEAINFSKSEFQSLKDVRELSSVNYFFYQFVLSIPIQLFSNKLLCALLFSTSVSLLCLYFLSKIISEISQILNIKRIALTLFIISPHILYQSITILKDILILLCFLVLILSSIKIANKRSNKLFQYICLILSISVCTLLRFPFAIILLFLSFILITNNSRNKILNSSYVLLAIGLIIINSMKIYQTNFFDGQDLVSSYTYLQERLSGSDSDAFGEGVTKILASNYSTFSLPMKFIYLPIITMVQFTHPINVWNFSHSTPNPSHYVGVNYKVIWLLFIGPIFIFTLLHYRKLPRILKVFAFISFFGYCFIAFVWSGIVPRYALIFQTLAIIPISYLIYLFQFNKTLRANYTNYMILYFSLGFTAFMTYLILFKF